MLSVPDHGYSRNASCTLNYDRYFYYDRYLDGYALVTSICYLLYSKKMVNNGLYIQYYVHAHMYLQTLLVLVSWLEG